MPTVITDQILEKLALLLNEVITIPDPNGEGVANTETGEIVYPTIDRTKYQVYVEGHEVYESLVEAILHQIAERGLQMGESFADSLGVGGGLVSGPTAPGAPGGLDPDELVQLLALIEGGDPTHAVDDPNSSHYQKFETYSNTQVDNFLDLKEDFLVPGAATDYYRGNKTWSNFANAVENSFSASVPIVLTAGDFSLDWNTTNLKLTSDQLNTIQDISTTSSPTFGGLQVTNTDTIKMIAGDGYVGIQADGTAPLIFYTNGANERMRIRSDGQMQFAENIRMNGNWISGDGADEGLYVADSGNVGIGTANPLVKFHILGRPAGNDEMMLLDRPASSDFGSMIVGGTGTGFKFGNGNRFFIGTDDYAPGQKALNPLVSVCLLGKSSPNKA